MQLFYSPDINSELQQFTFSKEESKHIVRVLRKKEGDTLAITNGKGPNHESVAIPLANRKQGKNR